MRSALVLIVATLAAAASTGEAPSGIAPDLLAACREAVPSEVLGDAAAGALRGAGEAGEWWVEAGDLDGDGSAEAFLAVLPTGRSGEVRFFARKKGGGIVEKRIKLAGGALTAVSIRFEPFAPGRSLAHVDGRLAGQVLLDWNGEKLETVWKVGKTRPGERYWFTLEDLDGDGVSEVSTYFQRELDVQYTDEEDPGVPGVAANTERIDLTAVYRWSEGRWRKDDRLLDERR